MTQNVKQRPPRKPGFLSNWAILFLMTCFLYCSDSTAKAGLVVYSYTNVFNSNADDYVYSTSNVFKSNEGNPKYYEPTLAGLEGTITYRFNFSERIANASLFAKLTSFSGVGGGGNGSLWGSNNGSNWTNLLDAPRPASFAVGVDYFYNTPLPSSLLNDFDLWLQVRLYSYGYPYYAQFSRSYDSAPEEIFKLTVETVPEVGLIGFGSVLAVLTGVLGLLERRLFFRPTVRRSMAGIG